MPAVVQPNSMGTLKTNFTKPLEQVATPPSLINNKTYAWGMAKLLIYIAINPFLDGLVSAGGDDVVTGGDEGDAADVVVVALQRLDALVRLKVPHFDGHVGRARDEQLPLGVEGDVLHRVRVALQRPLVVASLEVPYLHGYGCHLSFNGSFARLIQL